MQYTSRESLVHRNFIQSFKSTTMFNLNDNLTGNNKIEKNPTDDSKLVLTINKQPICEWSKEQFGKLGHGFRKTPDEPRKGGGFRL